MPSLLTKFLLIYKALLQSQLFQEALQNLSIPQQLSLHQNIRSSAIFFWIALILWFCLLASVFVIFFLHECLFPSSFSFLTSSQSPNPFGCTSQRYLKSINFSPLFKVVFWFRPPSLHQPPRWSVHIWTCPSSPFSTLRPEDSNIEICLKLLIPLASR